jgi:DNA-binding LacI/PurR family transcriptional regulator
LDGADFADDFDDAAAIEQIAQRACEILFAALASEPAAPRVEVLPSQLVLRASCGCGSS